MQLLLGGSARKSPSTPNLLSEPHIERQDLSRAYLAHHELESVVAIMIINSLCHCTLRFIEDVVLVPKALEENAFCFANN